MFFPIPFFPIPQKASMLDVSIKAASPVFMRDCQSGYLTRCSCVRSGDGVEEALPRACYPPNWQPKLRALVGLRPQAPAESLPGRRRCRVRLIIMIC
jgi:hypothetical protein